LPIGQGPLANKNEASSREPKAARCIIPKDAVAAAGLPGRDSTACQRDEDNAHSNLKNDWNQYSAQDRSRCSGFVTTGGAPSYVELLTCLEMAKQAKELREGKSKSETVGRGP